MIIVQLFFALIFGACVTYSLAPYDYQWLTPLSPAGLYLLLKFTHRPALIGWFFGLGLFGTGVSWVYVSISEHSSTPTPVGVGIVAAMVAILALLYAIQAKLSHLFIRCSVRGALGFIGLWVLGEWLRSWFLTGFPWLYIGNAAIDTVLADWVPVGGVWLSSFMFASLGVGTLLLLEILSSYRFIPRLVALTLVTTPWLIIFIPVEQPVSQSPVSLDTLIVQADIPQADKWDPDQLTSILGRYQTMSESYEGEAPDLIVWPETAISAFARTALPILGSYLSSLDRQDITLVSGIPSARFNRDHNEVEYFNSLAVMSTGSDIYHKQRLVPVGEYIPFERELRGITDFFNLPMSSFSLPAQQSGQLRVKDQHLAAAICYEIAYPALVRQAAIDSSAIITVSNDTWFGKSIAPAQHMQIAQMRALENGRWVIRSTNNGITGVIDDKGNIVAEAPRFQQATLRYSIPMMQGETLYQRWGDLPVLLLAFSFVLIGATTLLYHPNYHRRIWDDE
ncbi:MAG: apolipoprotein N-acyltransferase [Pontibacterium sp.]